MKEEKNYDILSLITTASHFCRGAHKNSLWDLFFHLGEGHFEN